MELRSVVFTGRRSPCIQNDDDIPIQGEPQSVVFTEGAAIPPVYRKSCVPSPIQKELRSVVFTGGAAFPHLKEDIAVTDVYRRNSGHL